MNYPAANKKSRQVTAFRQGSDQETYPISLPRKGCFIHRLRSGKVRFGSDLVKKGECAGLCRERCVAGRRVFDDRYGPSGSVKGRS